MTKSADSSTTYGEGPALVAGPSLVWPHISGHGLWANAEISLPHSAENIMAHHHEISGRSGRSVGRALGQRRDTRPPGKAADAESFESGESPSGTPSVSVRADFGLDVAEPDAITSLEARTRHLGAADQDPIDNAEVHDLHDLHVRREPGDHQFGLTV